MLIAGTSSGVGKTTVATGIMAALRRRGLDVGAAKVGPDFIDPSYHRLATGNPSRNLDLFLSPPPAVRALAAKAAEGRDILVIEGVMGLFDGAHEPAAVGDVSQQALPLASSAAVAALTETPVVLVIDASAMSQSAAALVHGYATWAPSVPVRGVIVNKVGSDAHETSLRAALEPLSHRGIPVLGVLRRDPALTWRDRHLGLVPVAERPGEIERALEALAGAIDSQIDLAAVMALAESALPLDTDPLPPAHRVELESGQRRPRIAVAGGPAFTFVYPETIERFEEAGAEIVGCDPLTDARLPEGIDGLWAGGGFPEVYAERLAANAPMLESVRIAARSGLPIWAECGGMLWLAEALDGHKLCGVVPALAQMTTNLTLGYRTANVHTHNPVAVRGDKLKGHEFHYSRLHPAGEALELANHREAWPEGHATPSLFATYLHLHLGADPRPAERFVASAAAWGARR